MTSQDALIETLARDRGRALVGYAYLLTWDLRAAEDLTQEALIRTLSRGRKNLDLWGAESYVRRTILHLYLDGHRRRARWATVRHLVVEPEPVDGELMTTAEQLDVRTALAELPRRERACVVLRYYDDLTVRQIAERLGVSEGAVKRYLSTGVHRMAHLLGPDTAGEEDEVTLVDREGK